MNKRLMATAAVVVGVAALAIAQPEKKPAPGAQPGKPDAPKGPVAQPDQPEQHDLMAAQPGPEHKKLAKLVGSWTSTAKFTAPGAPPDAMPKGEATAKMILGDRFLEIRENGTMMGMPFDSIQTWGFNNGSKKYESVWMYTMGTGMMTMTGESKDGGKTITSAASYINETGNKEEMTIVLAIESDDKFTITLIGKDPGGNEAKMESVYTRKK